MLHWREARVVGRFVGKIVPMVERELGQWRRMAAMAPDPVLSQQALASLTHKRFHAQGGCVYAAASATVAPTLVPLIVALQTISDYLDNLCDRAGCEDERAFRTLHQAMLDAVTPNAELADYYAGYPHQNDGGYLSALVAKCQACIRQLPGYAVAAPAIAELTSLYCDLQVYKHLPWSERESRVQTWLHPKLSRYPGLGVWELAAATGSTLGTFALVLAATDPHLSADRVNQLYKAYFPWIGALHILLDYYIDQGEDKREGDLNFCAYYPNEETCRERLSFFVASSLRQALSLPDSGLHTAVVRGLLAMYLSDDKIRREGMQETARTLIRSGGVSAKLMYAVCHACRRVGWV